MIKLLKTLDVEEQTKILDLVREWKTTEDGIKTIALDSDNSSLVGRGSTPKTFNDLDKLRQKRSIMYSDTVFVDYVVYNYQNEPVGIIGYVATDNHTPGINTLAYGLYIIQFKPNIGNFILIKSLYLVQDEMINSYNEIIFTSTRYNEVSTNFDYDVINRFNDRLHQTYDFEFTDVSGKTRPGKAVIIIGK